MQLNMVTLNYLIALGFDIGARSLVVSARVGIWEDLALQDPANGVPSRYWPSDESSPRDLAETGRQVALFCSIVNWKDRQRNGKCCEAATRDVPRSEQL